MSNTDSIIIPSESSLIEISDALEKDFEKCE